MGTRSSAHALVAKKFSQMHGPSPYWPMVVHELLRDEIDSRIDNPDWIWQSSTSLCGMASFFNSLAWDDPYLYAFYLCEMYRCGAAYLGYGSSNPPLVTASKATRSSKRPHGLPSADWIALASLRDHLNGVLHYSYNMGIPVLKEIPLLGFFGNPSLVEQVGGITYPEDMGSILKAVGYRNVVQKAYKSTHPGAASVHDANHYHKAGYRIVILINTDIMDDGATPSTMPDHWLRLAGPFEKKGNGYRVRVYNSQVGGLEWLPHSGKYLDQKNFLGNFFGFVAGRH
ncbi:MAG: hypothetical protein Fur0037_28300 [Planctomycetota bacterium]